VYTENIKLSTPTDLVLLTLDSATLFDKANSNNALFIIQQQRELEASQNLSNSRGKDFAISVRANYGLTQQASELNQAYLNPNDQQNLAITLTAPLYNFGKRRADNSIAEINRDIIKTTNQQETSFFTKELNTKYLDWSIQETAIDIAKRTKEVATKRYDVAKKRFLIGNLSIQELNLAQLQKDNAIQTYFQTKENHNHRLQIMGV